MIGNNLRHTGMLTLILEEWLKDWKKKNAKLKLRRAYNEEFRVQILFWNRKDFHIREKNGGTQLISWKTKDHKYILFLEGKPIILHTTAEDGTYRLVIIFYL